MNEPLEQAAGPLTAEDEVSRLRRQNHEHAEKRDREMADLRRQVNRYQNAYRRAKERVRGSPVDWTNDQKSQEPDGWWTYTSQNNRDILMAATLDAERAARAEPELREALHALHALIAEVERNEHCLIEWRAKGQRSPFIQDRVALLAAEDLIDPWCDTCRTPQTKCAGYCCPDCDHRPRAALEAHGEPPAQKVAENRCPRCWHEPHGDHLCDTQVGTGYMGHIGCACRGEVHGEPQEVGR